MENNKVVLRKIPLEHIVNILTTLFEQGYDYFDLEGHMDEEGVRDNILISVSDEYYSGDEEEEENNNNSPINPDDYEKLL